MPSDHCRPGARYGDAEGRGVGERSWVDDEAVDDDDEAVVDDDEAVDVDEAVVDDELVDDDPVPVSSEPPPAEVAFAARLVLVLDE